MAKKILIADDDTAILEATKMLLELGGYEVQTAVDGEAVSDAFKDPPDLLLLDIWMSGENGKDICKMLKAQKSTKHVPIIMISASRDIAESAQEAGADDFIAKPFEMSYLLAKIEEHVS
mgnify:CR=1 FL=1